MAWLTWRQHRWQLLAAVGLVLVAALVALLTDLPIRAAYHRQALASCLPPATRSGCEIIVSHFRSEFGARAAAVRYLMVLPVLPALFVGAPLLAREFEHGTFRLAWTQSVTRRRWLLSKAILLSAAMVIPSALLAFIVMWWRQPFDSLQGRMSPAGFDVEGLVVPAYVFFALSAGILAGAVVRRTIPAMSLAALTFLAARLAVEKLARPHYETPLRQTALGLTQTPLSKSWVIDNRLVDAVGRQISTAREDLAILHAQHARIDPQEYLLSLGWRRLVTFHPDARFWAFQTIEMSIFAVLGAVAVAVAVVVVNRRFA
jgi:hypothetical protein